MKLKRTKKEKMSNENLVKVRFWLLQIVFYLAFPFVIILAVLSVIYSKIFDKPKNVAGEVALITGGAAGLGKQIAIELAKKGCHIAVVDINLQEAEKTASEITRLYHVKSKAFKTDVGQYDQIVKLAKDVEEHLGVVTILINNAGILLFKEFKPTPQEAQNMININLTCHLFTIEVFMEKMRKVGKGHIVAIASLAGLGPCHRHVVYTASKFGVRGLMAALHTELYGLNAEFIKLTTVYPYFLKTNTEVDEIFNNTVLSAIHPSIPGEEAAKAAVDGILRNEMEVVIPPAFAIHYRLLELLPASWRARLIVSGISRESLTGLPKLHQTIRQKTL